jgi:HSP20 family protein
MSTQSSQLTERPNQGSAPAQSASSESHKPETILQPAFDIFEDGDGITIEADMAGVSKDRLNVHVEGENLILEGRVLFDMPAQARALHADVRSTLYRSSFVLSRELEADQIRATLKDGVVQVRIPKRAEVKPRRITVET